MALRRPDARDQLPAISSYLRNEQRLTTQGLVPADLHGLFLQNCILTTTGKLLALFARYLSCFSACPTGASVVFTARYLMASSAGIAGGDAQERLAAVPEEQSK